METTLDDRKNIKIPPELFDEIDRTAVKSGYYQSVAEFVREAIRLRLMQVQGDRDDETDQKATAAVSA